MATMHRLPLAAVSAWGERVAKYPNLLKFGRPYDGALGCGPST